MDIKDNPGDHIKRSGPNTDESIVIKQMVKDGAKVEDLYRRFTDIERASLRRWHISLTVPEDQRAAAIAAAAATDVELAEDAAEALAAAKKVAEQTMAAADELASKTIADAEAKAAKIIADAQAKAVAKDPLA